MEQIFTQAEWQVYEAENPAMRRGGSLEDAACLLAFSGAELRMLAQCGAIDLSYILSEEGVELVIPQASVLEDAINRWMREL
jgi:hypothetical protein